MQGALRRCLERDDGLVEVHPPFGSQRRLARHELRAAIEMPTPPERWFTPARGWPANADFDGVRPAHVVPTAEDDPSLFPVGLEVAESLGHIEIELLETEGLPHSSRSRTLPRRRRSSGTLPTRTGTPAPRVPSAFPCATPRRWCTSRCSTHAAKARRGGALRRRSAAAEHRAAG